MWLSQQGTMLTKDNLLKRNWQWNPSCYFCHEHESVVHLFFTCPLVKYVWILVTFVVGARYSLEFEQFWH